VTSAVYFMATIPPLVSQTLSFSFSLSFFLLFQLTEVSFDQTGPFWGRNYLFWHQGKPLTAIYEVFSPVLAKFLGPAIPPVISSSSISEAEEQILHRRQQKNTASLSPRTPTADAKIREEKR
jgi:hypothetical protein